METRLLGATVLLCLLGALHAFAGEEKDALEGLACPAFLMFDNTAYLAEMTLELPCYCKPEEVSSVVWYFQHKLESEKMAVLTDFAGTVLVDSSHIHTGSSMWQRFSIRTFSLIIFRARQSDSGHYLCGTEQGDFFYGYDVDVQPTKDMRVTFVDREQHVQEDYEEKLFSLFSSFWAWSRCDRCGVRGEQRRIGLCYVQSPQLHPRYRTALPNVTSCGSKAVPTHFTQLDRLRQPEVAIRSCLSPCPKKKAPEAGVQAISNVITKLGQKWWQTAIPTQYHRQPVGSSLVIACPGARPEHAVAWDKDSVRLYRSSFLLGINKSMRIFIDHGNHLHIRQLHSSDRGTYLCWREGQMVAAFRLTVPQPPQRRRSFHEPETIYAVRLMGISSVLLAIAFSTIQLCCCCWSLCRRPAR
ncbi:F187A protein, partial [Bucco capensis]|nr:F187A protein [Bucco capensis]